MESDRRMGDGGYEFKAVLVLSVSFGLMGLDRFIINPLFPVMAKDLGLGYGDIGLVSAALALTWGLAAIFTGRLADQVGVKTVLVPSILAFSVLVGLSGLATGLGGLLLVRGLMGLAEGAFVPASIVATTRASKRSRVGLNVGLLHMAAALFGLGLAPILATQLLKVLPSWHWVFALVAVPGLVMAFFIRRVLSPDPRAVEGLGVVRPAGAWKAVLTRRRVMANMLAMSCWLSGVTTMAALIPSYLTDHLQLDLDQMGLVLSGLGLGGVVGMMVVPALGDRFGYKVVALVAVALKLAALALFIRATGDVGYLFALSLAIGMTGSGVMAITVGPLTSAAVAPQFAATATGLVVGCGEIVGGALMPAVVGAAAARLGIEVVPEFAFGFIALGFLVLGFGGHAPERRVLAQPTAKAPSSD